MRPLLPPLHLAAPLSTFSACFLGMLGCAEQVRGQEPVLPLCCRVPSGKRSTACAVCFPPARRRAGCTGARAPQQAAIMPDARSVGGGTALQRRRRGRRRTGGKPAHAAAGRRGADAAAAAAVRAGAAAHRAVLAGTRPWGAHMLPVQGASAGGCRCGRGEQLWHWGAWASSVGLKGLV